MTERKNLDGQLLAGIILVALGAALLYDRSYLERIFDRIDVWWPSILIAFGLWRLAVCRGQRIIGPLMIVTVGVVFQLDRLNIWYWWRAQEMWPLFLIALGVGILYKRMRQPNLVKPPVPPPAVPPSNAPSGNPQAT